MAQQGQPALGDLARHLDNAFLLQRLDVLVQLARDAPVLRVDHQPAGLGGQGREAFQLFEVALQHADARCILWQV